MKLTGLLKKIKRWKKHLTIRKQIFLSLLFISMTGMVTLGYSIYNISKKTIEYNYKKSYEVTLGNAGKVLDMNLDPIIEISRSFLSDMNLERILNDHTEGNENAFSLSEQKMLKEIASNLTKQIHWVSSVAFIDFDGHYYLLSNESSGTYYFYKYYSENSVYEEDWIDQVKMADGKEVFFGDIVLGGIENRGFSIAKYMKNVSTGNPIGYVIINVRDGIIERSFAPDHSAYMTNSYLVVDNKADNVFVYYDKDMENIQDVIQAYYGGTGQQRYLFSSVRNETTGWELVHVIEKSELHSVSKNIRFASIFFVTMLIILCFILARWISKRITKPLLQLEKLIVRVGEGERHIVENFDDSETGRIGQKFKEMVNTNLELSESLLNARLNEREAELLLLQSQINPHFLYNTLDSLFCVAMIHGDDQILEMISSLSNYFKLSLNNGNKFCKVEAAVFQIREYVKLQNIRFNNRFDLHLDVDNKIMQFEILNFILQPFVENALYHGLEPKVGKGRISVQGYCEKDKLFFVIEDNGIGMNDLSVMDNGYGIKNVRERIKINYGDEFGFTVKSKKNKGTRIVIVLPAKKEVG